VGNVSSVKCNIEKKGNNYKNMKEGEQNMGVHYYVGFIKIDTKIPKIYIEMACFKVRVIYPLKHSVSENRQNDKYLNHLVKHYFNTSVYDCVSSNNREWWYDVIICDGDICDFLDCLPAPFYLDFIDYRYSTRRLYTNKRIKNDTQIFPRTPYENHLYWKAVYTEHNMPSTKIQVKIEKRWKY